MRTIDLITMGCSKNLVDSERLLFRFQEHGIRFFHNPDTLHGDTAIVNTCGFIADAKEESIEMILDLCQQKEEGLLKAVYVMGCLSERYRKELQEEIPDVDGFYGKFDWDQLIADLCGDEQKESGKEERVLTTPAHYAYIKISEGCDRTCAYCAIPLITGRHRSRSMESILEEVETLVKQGVKEFQLIAQDLTYYGIDLYGKQTLPELVERMAQVPGVEWIRLHYAYPAKFPKDLLRVMRENPNVCNYLDIALQHSADNVLNRMQRHITHEETVELLRLMRREVPGIHIRTTLMVGFPGETEEDFENLKDFVREMRFERMGAFAYSEEEGTYAALHFEDNVPEEAKQQRLDELMKIQEGIAQEISEQKIGQRCKIIIDRLEGDYYIGRTEADSPEVDCEVLIKNSGIPPLPFGSFHEVEITDCEEFDLYAVLIS